ncbi:hypothetical protein niasHT_025957 [Heterodera trifolii]|uniref:Uncharacterized protein n=1 Tax=Heterodera trifolii TaxID=157864 RepID=A0ABD2KQ10_9BILA
MSYSSKKKVVTLFLLSQGALAIDAFFGYKFLQKHESARHWLYSNCPNILLAYYNTRDYYSDKGQLPGTEQRKEDVKRWKLAAAIENEGQQKEQQQQRTRKGKSADSTKGEEAQ